MHACVYVSVFVPYLIGNVLSMALTFNLLNGFLVTGCIYGNVPGYDSYLSLHNPAQPILGDPL